MENIEMSEQTKTPENKEANAQPTNAPTPTPAASATTTLEPAQGVTNANANANVNPFEAYANNMAVVENNDDRTQNGLIVDISIPFPGDITQRIGLFEVANVDNLGRPLGTRTVVEVVMHSLVLRANTITSLQLGSTEVVTVHADIMCHAPDAQGLPTDVIQHFGSITIQLGTSNSRQGEAGQATRLGNFQWSFRAAGGIRLTPNGTNTFDIDWTSMPVPVRGGMRGFLSTILNDMWMHFRGNPDTGLKAISPIISQMTPNDQQRAELLIMNTPLNASAQALMRAKASGVGRGTAQTTSGIASGTSGQTLADRIAAKKANPQGTAPAGGQQSPTPAAGRQAQGAPTIP